MPEFIDITNRRFGRWTALAYEGNRKWVCICDCGKQKSVNGSTLRNGHSISCGCFQIECTVKRVTTHGMARKGSVSPEWHAWSAMKQRCNDPKVKEYKNYGGRGISVCSRWFHSFENFYADMGPRPSPKHSIERKNNNGDYEPGNCIWAVKKVQARNTRTNRILTYNEQSKTLAEWAEITGVKAFTISMRLKKGLSVEDALYAPLRTYNPPDIDQGIPAPAGTYGRGRDTTHCPYGHIYDTANTYYDGKNKRHCKNCRRIGVRRFWLKKHGRKSSKLSTEQAVPPPKVCP